MSVHPCGDSHAPPHNAFHAHGEPRDERAPRDDVIAGSSAATVSVRVCAGESPPRRSSAPAKEPGVSQWPSRRSLHLYQWRPRGRRTTKEDHGLTSPPDRSLDGSTLTDMASTLKQQQRVLDDLTTSVQELRVDVRKTSAGCSMLRARLIGSVTGATHLPSARGWLLGDAPPYMGAARSPRDRCRGIVL